MTPLARNILLTLVAVAFCAAVLLLRRGEPVSLRQQAVVREQLLPLRLDDTAGSLQALSQWQGKVLVLNFWATWCPPCLQEIPGFSRLQNKFESIGVQFVGIGIDSADKIRDFARASPTAYPLLIGSAGTLAIARNLGNVGEGLPYTVVLTRDGLLHQTRLGAWPEEDLEKLLVELTR